MPLNSRGSVSVRLSVWFSWTSAARNAARVGREDLDAAGIVPGQRRLAAHGVDGRPLLRAHLGQHQRAVGEVERGQSDLADQRRARRALQCSRPAIMR